MNQENNNKQRSYGEQENKENIKWERQLLYHISSANSQLGKRRSESSASFKRLSPSVLDITVHNRGSISVNKCWTLQEADWRQRNIVCGAPDHTLHWWLLRPLICLCFSECWREVQEEAAFDIDFFFFKKNSWIIGSY